MVRKIGETAGKYARRLEEPQREGESDEAYAKRIDTRVGGIEGVHGLDNEKFMTDLDGNPVLKEPYLQGRKIIEGTVKDPRPKMLEGIPAKPAIEGKQQSTKREGTGQIG